MRHTQPAWMSDPASVELTVTTVVLLNAIGLLAIHFPLQFHREAWYALTAEIANREIGMPARPIVPARELCDGLPPDVKTALRGVTPT